MGAVQLNLADCFVVPKSDFFSIFFFFTLVLRRFLYHAVFIMRMLVCVRNIFFLYFSSLFKTLTSSLCFACVCSCVYV